MRRSKRERELWVANRVADAINSVESTDYRAESGPNPPDAMLVSVTGRFPQIELEIVSLPIEDFTARDDNQNVLKLKDQLHRELTQHAFEVSVHLLDRGKRYGVPTDVVKRLVALIKQVMMRTSITNPATVDFGQMYQQYPDIAEYVSEVSVVSFRDPSSIFISVPLATYSPRDASWLLKAAAKKDLLARAANSRVAVAIDGSWLVDAQQISAFQTSSQISALPFAQLWLVTSFHGTVRLK